MGATIVDVRKEGEKLYVAQDPDLALGDSTCNETSAQQMQQSPMANTHSFANFQGLVDANIKTFVRTDEDAARFVTRLWNNFEAMTDGFEELIEIISAGKLIHSASDGSVLSDRRTSAGWFFWRPAAESDTILDLEAEDIKPEAKIIFGGIILVDGSLE